MKKRTKSEFYNNPRLPHHIYQDKRTVYIKKRTLRILCRELGYQLYRMFSKHI